jgi:hypothetical protein
VFALESEMANKHGPNRLYNYIGVHDAAMSHAEKRGIVVWHNVALSGFGDGFFLMSGTIKCIGGIEIDVKKVLTVVTGDGTGPDTQVQTQSYSYHAKLSGHGNILRYDSPHPHRPIHHAHRYDVFTGKEDIHETSPTDWPTLGEVIEELGDWYFANYDRLRAVGLLPEQ